MWCEGSWCDAAGSRRAWQNKSSWIRWAAMVCGVIIPPHSSVPRGALPQFDLANFKRRLRDGLSKTSALCAVGAVDLTLNEHSDWLFETHWAPHAHIIIRTDDIDGFSHELRAAFPRSAEAPKPVVIKRWDGDPRVFSYVYEPDFTRRISIEQLARFDPRTEATRFCRATTYDDLRASECVEVALFLDATGTRWSSNSAQRAPLSKQEVGIKARSRRASS